MWKCCNIHRELKETFSFYDNGKAYSLSSLAQDHICILLPQGDSVGINMDLFAVVCYYGNTKKVTFLFYAVFEFVIISGISN